MTIKNLSQLVDSDVRVRNFVPMQARHLLPRLVSRNHRLIAALYFYPVWQGDNPGVMRPINRRVLYDFTQKRPLLLEEWEETDADDAVRLWNNPGEMKDYMERFGACVNTLECCLQDYEKNGIVDEELLAAAEKDWMSCLPQEIAGELCTREED